MRVVQVSRSMLVEPGRFCSLRLLHLTAALGWPLGNPVSIARAVLVGGSNLRWMIIF